MERLRRLRSSPAIRSLLAETRLTPDRLCLPLFVDESIEAEEPIGSLPGQNRWPVTRVGAVVKEAVRSGISAMLLFGLPSSKDTTGSRAFADDGPTQRAITEAKASSPDLTVFADTCLCSFTDSGHCGILRNGLVDNDSSIEVLAQVAVSQARAGADFVSPSDMMDGRVGAIRHALDQAGLQRAGIMAYSAKFASAMYGPFRDAADCAPKSGDRRSYQIDPAAGRQAMRSIERDLREGADIVMVKPALAYLDVIRAARERFDAPISAYNVSGEYAMVKAAAERGWLDEEAVTREVLTSILRAGADFIITYHALDVAHMLERGR